MKSTIEPLDGNKVKLVVEIDEHEFAHDIDHAWEHIARDVRLPGFRPGKAPRKLLEKRIGNDVARSEALREALPSYYLQAVREHDVDVIAPPEIDITSGEGDGQVVFDAVVEIRPEVEIEGYGALEVTVPRPSPTPEEIDAQIDRMRGQYGELATVERPVAEGDHVLIDVEGSQGGEPLPGLTADDYLYEVGTGAVVPELDENLLGAEVGQVLEFEAEHPDPEQDGIAFRISVKEVKEKVLPDLTDEWAVEASEFETVDELRADLIRRLEIVRRAQAQSALRSNASSALAALVTDEVPDALLGSEMQARLQNMAQQIQSRGGDLGQYLAATGQDTDSFTAEIRTDSELAIKVDLALRALAEAEGLSVSEDDLEGELAEVGRRAGVDAAEVREQFERADQMSAVRSELRKRKALEWLLDRVTILDEDGNRLEKADLDIPEEPPPATVGASPQDADPDDPGADAEATATDNNEAEPTETAATAEGDSE